MQAKPLYGPLMSTSSFNLIKAMSCSTLIKIKNEMREAVLGDKLEFVSLLARHGGFPFFAEFPSSYKRMLDHETTNLHSGDVC